MHNKTNNRVRRHRRVRAKVRGTMNRPRLSVFRSNKYIYAQVIDDVVGKTLVGAHTKIVVASEKVKSVSKSDVARAMGHELARRAQEKKIRRVTFDRGGYTYQGRVRAVAEGAREGGLEF